MSRGSCALPPCMPVRDQLPFLASSHVASMPIQSETIPDSACRAAASEHIEAAPIHDRESCADHLHQPGAGCRHRGIRQSYAHLPCPPGVPRYILRLPELNLLCRSRLDDSERILRVVRPRRYCCSRTRSCVQIWALRHRGEWTM